MPRRARRSRSTRSSWPSASASSRPRSSSGSSPCPSAPAPARAPRAPPPRPGRPRAAGRAAAMTFSDLVTIAPLVGAVAVTALVLFVDLAWPGRRGPVLVSSLAGLAIVGLLTLVTGGTPATAFGGTYKVDDLTTFLDVLFIGIVAFTIAFGPDYLKPRGLPVAEFAIVLLFAMTGAMLIAASADLLVLFIGLELMVLPGYLLAGYHKSDGYSTEGAIKYFLLGSFSSAIFLFGLAFVWGMTGTTLIADVAEALAALTAGGSVSPGPAIGLAFLTPRGALQIP